MTNKVKFAAFGMNGIWRLEECQEDAFKKMVEEWNPQAPHWAKFDRIYKLNPHKDLGECKYKLFRVMRRYGVEPV